MFGYGGFGGGFGYGGGLGFGAGKWAILIFVLFILLIIVGASVFY